MHRSALIFALLSFNTGFGATIDGHVVEDHTNALVSLADVDVVLVSPHRVIAELETDSQGRFQSPDLPSGEYRLEISKPNFVRTTIRLDISGPARTVTGRLVRAAAFDGTVHDQQGRFIPSIHVLALREDDQSGPEPLFAALRENLQTQTDEHGHFRLFGMKPGRYLIAASYGASTLEVSRTGSARVTPGVGSGVAFYPEVLNVAGGEEYRNIDFTLGQSALFTVSGTISPFPKLTSNWLALVRSDETSVAAVVTQSEKDGTFKFEGVPPGDYELLASGPSRARGMGAILDDKPRFARSKVSVSGQNVTGIGIALGDPRSASVEVRAGAPGCAPIAKVRLTSLEDWSANLERDFDAAIGKETRLDNLAPARYQVRVVKAGENCYQASDAVIDLTAQSPTEPAVVTVAPAGSVQGTLSGEAANDVELVLAPARFTGNADQVRIETPNDGHFQFAAVRPGRYYLAARRAGGPARSSLMPKAPGVVEVDVRGGPPTEVTVPNPKGDQ